MEHRFLWHQLTLATDLPRKVFFEFFWRFGQALQRRFPAEETRRANRRSAGVPSDAQIRQVLNVPFGEMGKGVAIKMFGNVEDEEDKGHWVRGSLFRVMAEREYASEDGMRPYLTIPEVEQLLHQRRSDESTEAFETRIHGGLQQSTEEYNNPGLRLLRRVFRTAFKAPAEGGFLSATDAQTLQRKYEADVGLERSKENMERALVNAILDFEFLLDFSRVWMESEKGAVQMGKERFFSVFASPDIPYIDTVFPQRRKDKKITKPIEMTRVTIPEDPFQPVGVAAPKTAADVARASAAHSFRAGETTDEQGRVMSFGGGDWLLDADAPRSIDPKRVTRPRENWRVDTIPGQLLSRGIPMLHHWSGTLPTILGVVFQEVAPDLQNVTSAQVLRDMRILAMFFMLSFAPWHSLVENLVGLTFFEQTVFPRVWETAFVKNRTSSQQIRRKRVHEPEPAPSVTHAELRPEWILNWALRVFKEVGIFFLEEVGPCV